MRTKLNDFLHNPIVTLDATGAGAKISIAPVPFSMPPDPVEISFPLSRIIPDDFSGKRVAD